jgi:hypothetical protein
MAGKGHTVDAVGYDDVMQRIQTYTKHMDKPYFTCWNGSALKFGYYGEDNTEAEQMMSDNLRAIANNGSQALYELRFHPELDGDGYITNKSRYAGSFNFKMNEYAPATQGAAVSGVNQQMMQLLERMDSRLSALEDGQIEEVEEGEPMDAIGYIKQATALIEDSPALGGLVSDLRFGLRHLMKKAGVNFDAHSGNNGTVSGTSQSKTVPVETQEKFQYAMPVLIPIFPELGDILVKLANVAKNDMGDFNFYRKKLVQAAEQIEV